MGRGGRGGGENLSGAQRGARSRDSEMQLDLKPRVRMLNGLCHSGAPNFNFKVFPDLEWLRVCGYL